MITEKTRNSYSEVFELLKHVDRTDLNKIPMNLLETIKENRNKEYIPNINFENLNNSISKKALALYMWLYLTYIIEDKKEKERINKLLYENEIEANKKIELNPIFKKTEETNTVQENTQLIEYKPNIFQKIIFKIRKFLNKKK